MRYTHGCKPRNPYNMIIQENHAADRANLIISYILLATNNHIKEIKNAISGINHDERKCIAKEKNE